MKFLSCGGGMAVLPNPFSRMGERRGGPIDSQRAEPEVKDRAINDKKCFSWRLKGSTVEKRILERISTEDAKNFSINPAWVRWKREAVINDHGSSEGRRLRLNSPEKQEKLNNYNADVASPDGTYMIHKSTDLWQLSKQQKFDATWLTNIFLLVSPPTFKNPTLL